MDSDNTILIVIDATTRRALHTVEAPTAEVMKVGTELLRIADILEKQGLRLVWVYPGHLHDTGASVTGDLRAMYRIAEETPREVWLMEFVAEGETRIDARAFFASRTFVKAVDQQIARVKVVVDMSPLQCASSFGASDLTLLSVTRHMLPYGAKEKELITW